jgi:hypothetical protein
MGRIDIWPELIASEPWLAPAIVFQLERNGALSGVLLTQCKNNRSCLAGRSELWRTTLGVSRAMPRLAVENHDFEYLRSQ